MSEDIGFAPPISIDPRNVAMMGGNTNAVYLLEFFIRECRTEEGFGFVAISRRELSHRLGLSKNMIQTAVRALTEQGLLEQKRINSYQDTAIRYRPTVTFVGGQA